MSANQANERQRVRVHGKIRQWRISDPGRGRGGGSSIFGPVPRPVWLKNCDNSFPLERGSLPPLALRSRSVTAGVERTAPGDSTQPNRAHDYQPFYSKLAAFARQHEKAGSSFNHGIFSTKHRHNRKDVAKHGRKFSEFKILRKEEKLGFSPLLESSLSKWK